MANMIFNVTPQFNDGIADSSASTGSSGLVLTANGSGGATWVTPTVSGGTVTSVSVSMNGSTVGTVTTSGTIDLGTVVTSETDPVFSASAASGITSDDITNWNDVVHASTGGTFNGALTINSASTGISVGDTSTANYCGIAVSNANGTVTLNTTTNRGVWDETDQKWIVYHHINGGTVRTPYPFVGDSTGAFGGAVTVNATGLGTSSYAMRVGDTSSTDTVDLQSGNSSGLVGFRTISTVRGFVDVTDNKWILTHYTAGYVRSDYPVAAKSGVTYGSTLPTGVADGQIFFKTS